MKPIHTHIRTLLALIVLSLASIQFASAQIQTRFFGSTLGKTSSAQFKANLDSLGIEYEVENDSLLYILDVSFGQYKWDASVAFCQDKFLGITFGKYQKFSVPDKLRDTYNYLCNIYKTKYKRYDMMNPQYPSYSDGKNYIMLSYRISPESDCQLEIFYVNLNLMEKRINTVSSDY